MPIVATSVLEARRAAAAAREAEMAAAASPPPPPPSVVAATSTGETGSKPKRRGHAVKDENGKWLPTSDAPGWCNPPVKNQFQKDGPGGPGRPKGSVSQDTLWKRALDQKRPVRIDGKKRKLNARELVVLSTVKDAVEGKCREARKRVLSESARIYGEDKSGSADAPGELNASDALSLAELEAELRREIREELLRELRDREGEAK